MQKKRQQRPKMVLLMEIGMKELEGLIRYAKAQCETRCPQERDAEVCMRLIELCKTIELEPPFCFEETEGFSKRYFSAKIREIEKRRNKPIEDFLAELRDGGPKTLEDEIDRIDGEFAVKALRAINARNWSDKKK